MWVRRDSLEFEQSKKEEASFEISLGWFFEFENSKGIRMQ